MTGHRHIEGPYSELRYCNGKMDEITSNWIIETLTTKFRKHGERILLGG